MIIGDGIMLGASGVTTSIFVTGLSETDSVSAAYQIPAKILNPEWKSLPSGYTQLKYIQGTGLQYIDLDKPVINNQTKFECNIEFTSFYNDDYDWFIGSRFSTTNWLAGYYNGRACYWSDYTYAGNLSIGERTVLTVDFVNHQFTSSSKGVTASISSYALSTPARLFIGNGSSFSKGTKCKCYGVLQYNNNLPVLNLIPCKRNSDGAVGMIDIINSVFYANKGSGMFETGPEVTEYIDGYVDGKTVIGKWTQKPNPAYVTLPAGYTQLEYIESTGTQYIDTKIIPSNHMTKTSFYIPSMKNNTSIFGTSAGWKYYTMSPNTDYGSNTWAVGYNGTGNENGAPWSAGTHTIVFNGINNHECILNGVTFSTGIAAASTKNLLIFNGEGCLTGKCYYFKITDRISGNLVRDYVSCKRNSDNTIGMYDLVSNTFFSNSGKGAFIAGPEVPQTIGSFLIDKIKDCGTWTVTATDGTKTATQDVLVITEYEIKMSLST